MNRIKGGHYIYKIRDNEYRLPALKSGDKRMYKGEMVTIFSDFMPDAVFNDVLQYSQGHSQGYIAGVNIMLTDDTLDRFEPHEGTSPVITTLGKFHNAINQNLAQYSMSQFLPPYEFQFSDQMLRDLIIQSDDRCVYAFDYEHHDKPTGINDLNLTLWGVKVRSIHPKLPVNYACVARDAKYIYGHITPDLQTFLTPPATWGGLITHE